MTFPQQQSLTSLLREGTDLEGWSLAPKSRPPTQPAEPASLGLGGPRADGTEGSVPGGRRQEEERPRPFWRERMRQLTPQYPQMPFLIKARRHGCAVLPELTEPRHGGCAHSLRPAHEQRSPSIPPAPGSCSHDCMPGMLSPFPR